ncbi:RNA-directed DNA polymerase, eukaryota [Tanacetum coccineum]|uniref:RNA-directed DNA polymerase, eukaryota n=1 Tax=Tanacetum coccineum TaxID=301880 RepID=A0ABQ4WYK8_9ASTR
MFVKVILWNAEERDVVPPGPSTWHSKEDQTLRISKSVFVTNFPETCSSRDLWKVCNDYGSVVDVFIPIKKSKADKRFAFVRFIKVKDLDRLVANLCTIWIGRFHIHANVARFHRPLKPNTSIPRTSDFGTFKTSFASVLKEGYHKDIVNSNPALVLDDTCIKDHDFSLSLMGKVRNVTAIPNLYSILFNEGFHNTKITYLGGTWVLLVTDSVESKDKLLNHIGVGSWFSIIKESSNSFVCDERIIWVSIDGLPINAWTPNSLRKIASLWGEIVEWEISDSPSLLNKPLCLKTKNDVIINECCKIIIQGKVYWIRAKETHAWIPTFAVTNQDFSSSDDESDDNIGDDFVGDKDKIDSSDIDRVSESSFSHVNDLVHDTDNNNVAADVGSHSDDPFNLYGILNNQHKKANNSSTAEPEYPLDSLRKLKERKLNDGVSSHHSMNSRPLSSKEGGSILDVMEEIIKVGQTMGYNMEGLGNKTKKGWIKELCHKHRINFLAIQETKLESIDLFSIKSLWGNLNFDHVVGPSVGFSGGILCVWDSCVFIKDHVSKSDYFVAIMGTWVPTSTKLLIISVYAPQQLTKKRDLWNYLHSLIDRWDGKTVIMGDFNEVRYKHERFSSTFNSQGANAFNNFISLAGLIDLPLEGYTFTWAHKSASKMSKLDRFLLSEGLFLSFPYLSALCLDRYLSDHRPILLKENSYDFGPTPFCIFHSWFSMEGFDSFVESTWKSMHVTDSNGLVRMKKKLQLLKSAIKVWIKETKARSYEKKINILQNLSEADKSIDRGDENTKYFHGILNKKRSQLAIRGTLVNGEWISNPVGVKREFYSHFKNQFLPSYTPRLSFDFVFPNRLSTDQVEDLERLVTYDEVKRAVWDCGANKSPGPDEFTFEFFCKFWKTLDQDVFQAVFDFFENGHIPRGCNASFIALIPKIHDAKIVKDFWPISLIGSIYKIITKILANRLCNVLPCLISEVQSAFVSNRNILDGPFILDELLQWCKHKRKRAMIFKVDFEKAFDSVKWDYLIDTLRAFGFGQKWFSWINGCFETATGSVLVNGSPTSEFQFHRGLKQGDYISLFLFILIMETLHLSFKRVIESNLFKGISINASFSISHLFYADDVVFIGEWNSSNIKTVAKVLNCFYLASGLKINFYKSKLMGVGVNSNEVESIENLVGCSTFSTPFKYLGVIVGDNMSRLKPWEDVISKVSNRLSNWKLKTLSIGGRLTLIKSVISSIPLYHMSIFKAPMGVLNKLESIRRNFFNGIDGMDKTNSWIRWDKILASKKNGGLGVSTMHGNHGALSSCVTSLRRSSWLDIIREMYDFNSKGIELMQFLKKKLGNGENTSFWDDKWHDDGPFKSLYPRLHALDTCKSISVASKLSQPTLIHSFRRPPRGGVEEE